MTAGTDALIVATPPARPGWASPTRAVVEPERGVYGIDATRVADVSVMPTAVRGDTDAATIVIGEKAAGLTRAA